MLAKQLYADKSLEINGTRHRSTESSSNAVSICGFELCRQIRFNPGLAVRLP